MVGCRFRTVLEKFAPGKKYYKANRKNRKNDDNHRFGTNQGTDFFRHTDGDFEPDSLLDRSLLDGLQNLVHSFCYFFDRLILNAQEPVVGFCVAGSDVIRAG
jgi:hypothetical protein